MNTDIYKSLSINNTFLLVPKGKEIDKLPENILNKIGKLEYYKTIILTKNSPLISNDSNEIIKNLKENGYYIEGIDINHNAVSEVGASVGGGILAASLGLGLIGVLVGVSIGYWLVNHSKNESN